MGAWRRRRKDRSLISFLHHLIPPLLLHHNHQLPPHHSIQSRSIMMEMFASGRWNMSHKLWASRKKQWKCKRWLCEQILCYLLWSSNYSRLHKINLNIFVSNLLFQISFKLFLILSTWKCCVLAKGNISHSSLIEIILARNKIVVSKAV